MPCNIIWSSCRVGGPVLDPAPPGAIGNKLAALEPPTEVGVCELQRSRPDRIPQEVRLLDALAERGFQAVSLDEVCSLPSSQMFTLQGTCILSRVGFEPRLL